MSQPAVALPDPPAGRLPARRSAVFALAGVLAAGLYFLLSGRAQSALFPLPGAASVVAIFAGARRLPPGTRTPWLWFGAGVLAQLAGDVVFSVYETGGREPPPTSVADAFYVTSYPLLLVGLFLVLRRLGGQAGHESYLDTAVLFAAVALVQWVSVIAPFDSSGEPALAHATDVYTQAMDGLLIIALVQLLVAAPRRNLSLGLLLVGTVCWAVADETFAAAPGAYSSGSWIDGFWLAGYGLWGAAALDPSFARLGAGADRRRVPRLTNARLAVLALALAVAPAVLIVERAVGDERHLYAIAIGGVAIGTLVLLRLAGLVHAVESSRRAERLARRDAESAQQQLAEQNARLIELDRLKDEFLSSVTHELRTPLTSISGYAELLLDEEQDEERRAYIDVIDRNAGRLLALVTDLLLAARLQSGEFGLGHEPVDVRRLVDEAVEAAAPHAQAGGVSLAAELDGDGELVAAGDALRLAQVLDNLVSNAVKFTPSGGSVRVAARAEPGHVVLEVVDTGIGIPETEHPSLFQRFYRTPEATERQIQGTGLGLYITKAIVDAHAGSIRVQTTEGGGTTVIVKLPKP